MASLAPEPRPIQMKGDTEALLDRLREPLLKALGGRSRFYAVEIETIGRVGDVLVSITGSKGHLPLLFGHDELEPGFVSSVVRDAVDRFAL